MKKYTGVTLIELMVTIAVLAILASIAVPNFVDLLRNNRVTSDTNRLLADINFARGTAISEAVTVSLCQFDVENNVCDGTGQCNCRGQGDGRGFDWDDGWIIFTNNNANNRFEPAAGEALLKVGAQADNGITIRSSARGGTRFSFAASGAIHPQDENGTAQVICFQDSSTLQVPCRVLQTRITGAAGTIKLADGASVVANDYDFE